MKLDLTLPKKKSVEEWLQDFGKGIKKIRLPKNIDWDEMYYSQLEECLLKSKKRTIS